MKDEVLLGIVVVVWAALATVYAVAPGLGMPGYARVWGAGAAVFLTLVLILRKVRRRGH
jgi:multisubunit Na+/H+ antiporter MnhB subunit